MIAKVNLLCLAILKQAVSTTGCVLVEMREFVVQCNYCIQNYVRTMTYTKSLQSEPFIISWECDVRCREINTRFSLVD